MLDIPKRLTDACSCYATQRPATHACPFPGRKIHWQAASAKSAIQPEAIPPLPRGQPSRCRRRRGCHAGPPPGGRRGRPRHPISGRRPSGPSPEPQILPAGRKSPCPAACGLAGCSARLSARRGGPDLGCASGRRRPPLLIHRPRGGPGGGAGIRCCHLCSGLRAGRSIRLRRPPGRLDLRFRRPCPASPRTSAACPPAEAGKRAATHSAANVLTLADAARADARAQSLVEAAFHARPPKPAPLVAPVSGVVLRPATRRYRPRGVNPHRLGARGGGEMTPARRPPLSEPPGATAAWTQTPSSRCPSAPYGGPCPDCVVDGRDPTVTAHRIT